MNVLWRGSWATRARIATGLVLFVYVLLHFLNIGLGIVSTAAADAFQTFRTSLTRSLVGTVIVYGALAGHALLSLSKITFSTQRHLPPVYLAQVCFGILIPIVLAGHVVFTRGAHAQFGTNDTLTYLAGLIWGSRDGWWQASLLVLTWVHGCIGMHMWLRLLPRWRQWLPVMSGLAVFVPLFALAGFATEGRRGRALYDSKDPVEWSAFLDQVAFPDAQALNILVDQKGMAEMAVYAVLAVLVGIYVVRLARRPRRTLQISYTDGPTISTAPGPTLLEISEAAGVPHTALCGGRGRCTTCRVIVEAGAADMPPPSPAEQKALAAVGAGINARLACQMRPTAPATVYRVFEADGRRKRGHASHGTEAQLAILFLDMRGFTARTAGQLPYDVVFLLNRFFDAVVPAITGAGGTVDKYLGDGLLAVFETSDATSSAKAGLQAIHQIGHKLADFNARLEAEGAAPVRIGVSLHLGTVVLGEIGAAGQAPRTLIGDTVNTASRLEAETKALGVEALVSASVLTAAGIAHDAENLATLRLRGVDAPLRAMPIPDLKAFAPV